MSKTNRDKPGEKPVKRKPHPKRYTDPITGKTLKALGRNDVDKFIIEELEDDDSNS